VVTEPRLPSRIRQGLNVESGLNDGICVPLLFIVLATAEVDSNVSGGHSALTIVFEEIGYGLLGGLAAGLLVSAVVVVAGRRGLITGSWLRIVPVAGAALAYGLATALGGSGFIAAFLAGALVVEESHLPHVNTILLTTYTTVGLSVLAHGATAAPLADLYARWYASRPRDQLPPMESVDAAAHRVRGAGFAAEHGAP
jgi:NhaP-type Na+/H+ or K+/H+ antiporter